MLRYVGIGRTIEKKIATLNQYFLSRYLLCVFDIIESNSYCYFHKRDEASLWFDQIGIAIGIKTFPIKHG